ncbi:hypothetical protein D1BOALGB6SA_6148 [Olavius sp. associated proteobacterium Delta 1]|nr:hypothetical protein D1BOALGB6SA_6148 [Olavius sp. associated proteobacterium Delta 1]
MTSVYIRIYFGWPKFIIWLTKLNYLIDKINKILTIKMQQLFKNQQEE